MAQIYFVEKVAVYNHGVFWIGTDLEEGHREARNLAQLDSDDHHAWVLCAYSPSREPYGPDLNEEIASYRHGHLI